MDFEQLKHQWQQQARPRPAFSAQEQQGLMARIRKVRRIYIRQNILISLCMLLVFGVVGWIWLENRERSWPFHLVLGLLLALITAALLINWRKVTSWQRYDFTENTNDFLAHIIRKLRYIQWTTRYASLAYTLLLWLIMGTYMRIIGEAFPWKIQLGLQAMLAAWMLFSFWWSNKRQKRKDEKNFGSLLPELERLKQSLSDTEKSKNSA